MPLAIGLIQMCHAQHTSKRSIRFNNITGAGFVIKLQVFNCDSIYSSSEIPITHSDTLFEVNDKCKNLVFTLFSKSMSLQVGYMLHLPGNHARVDFRISDSIHHVAEVIRTIKIDNGNKVKPFDEVFKILMLSAMEGRAPDTFQCVNLLQLHLSVFADNYFAYWLLYQLTEPYNPTLAQYSRGKIADCRHVYRLFFPDFPNQNKAAIAEPRIVYDSLIRDLGQHCVSTKGPGQSLLPDSDTVLLIFWASWCGPCIRQIKEMRDTEKNAPDICFISVDHQKEVALRSAEHLGIDKKLWYMDASILKKYGYSSIPLHLVLLRTQKVVYRE